MKQCISLAKLGEIYVAPNPMVGCVIVYNGKVVAEGYHAKFGDNHAEVMAFDNLSESIPVTECDVFVNLEPCSHFGKTPPCANLIINKRPNRLIVGMLDPNKLVAGSGVKKILEAGLDVKIGVLEKECRKLNRKYIKSHSYQLPYVTLKWAETKNCFISRKNDDNSSRHISDKKNQAYVHQLRASHQALLVGANTVNRDNPHLDIRHSKGNSPIKVILSPSLSVNFDSQLFKTGSTIVYSKLNATNNSFYEIVKLENYSISAILTDLYERGIFSVLVEGGPTILQAFIDDKEWDEAIILQSLQSWDTGIKAPSLGVCPQKEKLVNNDIIKYFLLK